MAGQATSLYAVKTRVDKFKQTCKKAVVPAHAYFRLK